MIENELKLYVKETCKESTNLLTESFYEEHILVVYYTCKELCRVLNVESEISCLSAILHDISAVLDFKSLPTHNMDSAEIAKKILLEKEYPYAKIEKVKQCIQNHMFPIKINEGSIDDVILSNADAISQILNPSYWLFFSFKIKNMSFKDGIKWYVNKIDSNWNSMIEPAKELIKTKYMMLKFLLDREL